MPIDPAAIAFSVLEMGGISGFFGRAKRIEVVWVIGLFFGEWYQHRRAGFVISIKIPKFTQQPALLKLYPNKNIDGDDDREDQGT
jgi:hypothetical protein